MDQPIVLNSPCTLTLSPQTISTILDVLSTSGPWKVVDPAIKEILSQITSPPPQEHTDESKPAE